MSKVKFFELPLAIVTIIVSPIAREIPRTKEAIIPEKAAGMTTLKVVSSFVAPIANDPSRIAFGTEFIASSEREAIIGIIITPMTIPGLKIFVASTSGQTERISGVTKVKAKNPYTMVGIPARTSNNGFKTLLTLSEAYSLK